MLDTDRSEHTGQTLGERTSLLMVCTKADTRTKMALAWQLHASKMLTSQHESAPVGQAGPKMKTGSPVDPLDTWPHNSMPAVTGFSKGL
jgi:hypothetical protein